MKVRDSALYAVGEGLRVEADGGAQEGREPLLAEEGAIWGSGLDAPVGVEYQGVAGGEAGYLFGEVRVLEHADSAAREDDLAHTTVGLERQS